jgi:hypothetical protein
MCFDFRRARSHPLGSDITSHLPGRFAMYTSGEARVKVLNCLAVMRVCEVKPQLLRSGGQLLARGCHAIQAPRNHVNASRV